VGSGLGRAASRQHVGLTALQLTDVRNYASLHLDVASVVVVLTGANGAGKTNLLEAISLLTPGRGLRRAAFEEIARHGAASGWAVAASVQAGGEATRLGTGTTGADAEGGGQGGRKVRINGASASAEALLDYLRVLWLTPAMDGLFTGPAGDRRRFLDRLVLTVDPGHARRVRDLDRLLTQRNRLLEEGRGAAWLDALEAPLAETAIAVAVARAETVALLAVRLGQGEPAFPTGRVALTGPFAERIASVSAAEAELWYRDGLARGRAADRAAGRTLEGPHRSDLAVSFAATGMPAALCSTGEQKALLIGLILGHAELVAEVSGMAPVLLLDEVAAHLDPARRMALFDRLAQLGCQSFLTGADPALFADMPAGTGRYRVADGRVDAVGSSHA
jgi:DNA replication and repair protein RecF